MDNELDFEIETEEKNLQTKKNEEGSCEDEKPEAGDDDGECTDDDDDDDDGSLEEGELKEKDDGNLKPPRQVCRFYNRGQCFYGNVCRFLHLNNESKGNYNMFAPPPVTRSYESAPVVENLIGLPNAGILHRIGPRSGPDFVPVTPPSMPPLPVVTDAPPVESAWEKGLREARELVKQGKIRKKEPDFEDKRLNLSLTANDKRDFDKENDITLKQYKKKKRQIDIIPRFEETEIYDVQEPRMQACYENFEMKFYNNDHNERGRERWNTPIDKRPKAHLQRKDRERMRDDRMKPVQSRKAEEFFDPWRRSKSPKHNQRRTRSRSFGSFSSVSSYSYSSRSSYSRSSSRSSGRSSKSHSPHQNRKPSPLQDLQSPNSPNKFTDNRKKPGPRRNLSRSRSITGSRSRSRSISMDSVSSASSSPVSRSRSSSADSTGRRPPPTKKENERGPPAEAFEVNIPSSNLYQEMKMEKSKDPPLSVQEDDIDPLEEKFHMQPERTDAPFQNLHHVLPPAERTKESVKGLHKQPIKLTLLNKNMPSKLTNLPKKEFEIKKEIVMDDPSKVGMTQPQVKRPTSPSPAAAQKKSASSRRDELLKQLKAVEDAIARKRAKFS